VEGERDFRYGGGLYKSPAYTQDIRYFTDILVPLAGVSCPAGGNPLRIANRDSPLAESWHSAQAEIGWSTGNSQPPPLPNQAWQ